MSERRRVWGVYDWDRRRWEMQEIGGGRKRWPDADKAAAFITELGRKRGFSPRPFYVTKKPRKLPLEIVALIAAVKSFDASRVGWASVVEAIKRYDEANQ